MARTKRTPKLRPHSSGRGFVELSGRRFYLGPYDDEATQKKARRLIGEWLDNGRRLPRNPEELTITELAVRWFDHCEEYYRRPDGSPTRTIHGVRIVLRRLRRDFGDMAVRDFGPKQLKLVRASWIGDGLARNTINAYTCRLVLLFRWGVEEEFVDVSVYQRLCAVKSLGIGRSKARETEAVRPAPMAAVEAVMGDVCEQVAAMIRIQLLCGCRPGELALLRPCDVDRGGDVWLYRPRRHKTMHHGRDRLIALGPQAQSVLRPLLLRTKAKGEVFATTGHTYAKTIRLACKRLGVAHWTPNQLRHNCATEMRKAFGLDTARTVLGHASADMTTRYAEQDTEAAMNAVRKLG